MPPRITKPTKEHGNVLRLRLKGMEFSEIGEKLGIGAHQAQHRFNVMRRFLHPNTIARVPKTWTKTTPPDVSIEELVQRRLAGDSLRKIHADTGVHYEIVRRRLADAAPTLDSAIAKRLAVGGTRENFEHAGYAEKREKMLAEFRKQLEKTQRIRGAFKLTAKELKISLAVLRYNLRKMGVNPTVEANIAKTRVLFRVADHMHLSTSQAAKKLEMPYPTIRKYRQAVLRGEHLQGALQHVEHPDADQWWEMQLPAVHESPDAGSARINLSTRNEAVSKDLEFFDASIKAAVAESLKHHHDVAVRGGVPNRQKYEVAIETRDKLKRAKQRYLKKERAFRKRYRLPLSEELEQGIE